MRVLFFDNNPVLRYLLPKGFENLGHEVKVTGPFSVEEVPGILESFQPALIVLQGWHMEVTWNKIHAISREAKLRKIPIIYWSVEDPVFTQDYILPIVQALRPDFVFTISKDVIGDYNKYGFRASFLDFACNPGNEASQERKETKGYDITLISNSYAHAPEWYPFRFETMRMIITPLIKANIKIDIWGENWHKMSGFLGVEVPRSWIHEDFLPYEKALEIYRNSKINLGLQNSPEQLTLRTFDILGVGGFLLTAETKRVRELFTPGEDLITTSCAEETVWKVQHYLEKEEERKKISANGKKSAQKYTYTDRAAEVLRVLKEKGVLTSG